MEDGTLAPERVHEALPSLRAVLAGARGVRLGTHLNPDGDAIGSALGLSLWLDRLGVPHEVLCHNEPPGYLRFLPGSDRVLAEPTRPADVGIVLDLEALERLGSCRPYFEGLTRLVVIDHHIPHEAPGDLRIVSTAAPATCSILVDLLDGSDPGIDADVATCLLTGIVTDTGSFRFSNTTARCLHQAARLVELGASAAQVASECYLNRDEAAVRLLGEALHRVRTDMDGRLAWVALPAELFDRLGAKEEHTEGIVNEVLSVRTVQIAAVLRPGKNGKVKGSLRSKGDLDVAAVAREIGGGGHKNAAGVTYTGTLEEAETVIMEGLRRCLASSSSINPPA